ncbi:multicopper oxidase-domain-containing protein [Blyttiomyces helicus]|uniref:Multicopper oxidase-domain-containing protein n=1 Tax=Blyttiomyces helicus TaxID=388810 RepID=A0A4P9W6J0_9FUNG|nr:multicopper oxidase-domain-containing protein [Blyttiomyces helicus]|eukprot:RKO85746.1 multicopper oxidase-domain-containing protein [Blyttiomyces helicus]
MNSFLSFDIYYQSQNPPILAQILSGTAPSALSPNANAVELKFGQVVQLVFYNYDTGEHPWHLHGHNFWIVAQGTASSASAVPTTFTLPAGGLPRRDVVTLAACPQSGGSCIGNSVGYTVIRWVADNPGVWFFHCHIEWHVEAGLVMMFVEDVAQIVGNKTALYSGVSLAKCPPANATGTCTQSTCMGQNDSGARDKADEKHDQNDKKQADNENTHLSVVEEKHTATNEHTEKSSDTDVKQMQADQNQNDYAKDQNVNSKAKNDYQNPDFPIKEGYGY